MTAKNKTGSEQETHLREMGPSELRQVAGGRTNLADLLSWNFGQPYTFSYALLNLAKYSKAEIGVAKAFDFGKRP